MLKNKLLIMKIIVFLALSALTVVNVRLVIDNLLLSGTIDEAIVNQANPRLDKGKIDLALAAIKAFQSSELTSFFTSDTVDNKADSEEQSTAITIEIQNASGINGAATNVAEKLQELNYIINAISTAPAKNNQTTLFYRQDQREKIQKLEEILKNEGWPVSISQLAEAGQSVDFIVVLGK